MAVDVFSQSFLKAVASRPVIGSVCKSRILAICLFCFRSCINSEMRKRNTTHPGLGLVAASSLTPCTAVFKDVGLEKN